MIQHPGEWGVPWWARRAAELGAALTWQEVAPDGEMAVPTFTVGAVSVSGHAVRNPARTNPYDNFEMEMLVARLERRLSEQETTG
jgi:hypothetical protein